MAVVRTEAIATNEMIITILPIHPFREEAEAVGEVFEAGDGAAHPLELAVS